MSREQNLDRVIDDVARALTAGVPHAAFRTRVLARIASGDRVRRSWPAGWIAAPLAAAALTIIAVLLGSRSPERLALHRSETPAASKTARPTVRLKPDTTAESEARTPNREARIPNPESRIPNPESRIPNPESRIPSAVAALAPPALNVDSIALAPIGSGDSLEVQQLAAPPPLDIEPLDIEKEIHR